MDDQLPNAVATAAQQLKYRKRVRHIRRTIRNMVFVSAPHSLVFAFS